MSKRKHTAEWMIARVEDYLVGKGSYKTIAEAYSIGETTRSKGYRCKSGSQFVNRC